MDQQEARDILKGCGGCLLFLAIFCIAVFLWFTVGFQLFTLLFVIPVWFLVKCGPWILFGLIALLILAFIVYMIKVILKACGII